MKIKSMKEVKAEIISQKKDEILLLLNDRDVQKVIVNQVLNRERLFEIIPEDLRLEIEDTSFGVVIGGTGITALDCIMKVKCYLLEPKIVKVIEERSSKDITYDHCITYDSDSSYGSIAFYLNYRRVGDGLYNYTPNIHKLSSSYGSNKTNDSLAKELGRPRYVVCEIIPYLSEYSNTMKRINMHIAKMKKDYSRNKNTLFYPIILTYGPDNDYHYDETKIQYDNMVKMLEHNGIDVLTIDNIISKKETENI